MILGLDVGGTHTDVVLIDKDGIHRQAKVPTDHADLLGCVRAGIEGVTDGIPPDGISRVVLSTTLTTNAIIEGKTNETAVIVSAGPGVDPEFFRTGTHYYCVGGSIDHRGREIQSVKASEIQAIASKLKTDGIRQVAVVSKFSVRNPKHEIQIRDILGDSSFNVVLGHRLSGNLNFPRRIATAYLNAAVCETHRRFFDAVRESLEKKGLNVPIYVLKADGGTMSLEASLQCPGQTILSGPAASVMGSVPFASETEETLVLDIGGTSTDMAILIRKVPLLDPLGCELGGYKTLIRALKTVSIGLGGDSVVRLADGGLSIGPDRKGPAMAYGGPVPTPTDALFVLGKVTDGGAESSRRGLQPIADGLGMSLEDTANRIFDEACRKILSAAGEMISNINSKPVYTVQELLGGYQVRPGEILVLGGPAPHFARRLGDFTDSRVRVVPRWQVANALGAALAKNTSEVTLFADTERGIAVAPEEDFYKTVKRDFDRESAVRLAFDLLRDKCVKQGAVESELEMEVIEDIQFNMVRSFYTSGRNIRVKVQVKPGLIPGYREIADRLAESVPPQT